MVEDIGGALPKASVFDPALIREVNRIELQPNEVVVFQTTRELTGAESVRLAHQFDNTPLQGRAFVVSGDDWSVFTINAGVTEETPK